MAVLAVAVHGQAVVTALAVVVLALAAWLC
jgi:hypothetical protein